MNSFSLKVTSVKLDVRKYLDIVCEIKWAIFVRQLAMFLNSDKMMKLFKLRLHLFKKKKKNHSNGSERRRKSGVSYLYISALKFPCDSYAAISVCKPRKLT